MKLVNSHRSGYVAVIGRPNVGKSTLVNALLAQKIAAVSAKPQTTRRRQLGILSSAEVQVVFVDTPGLHVPQHKLGDYMNQEAVESLHDADLILWLLDASVPFTREDNLIADRLNALKQRAPVLMILTKIDLVDEETIKAREKQAIELFPADDIMFLSAVTKAGLDTASSTDNKLHACW